MQLKYSFPPIPMNETPLVTSERNDLEIGLRSIQQLTGESFWIPAYQRGYRWGESQVRELLNDIQEFQPEEDASFYCLQPLVIKRSKERWEVIDGQQRLTTIALILRCLGNLESITITYETREESEGFLASPNEEGAKKNIDFHFIHQAFEAIKAWKNEKREIPLDEEELRQRLLHRVKVIWYPATENSVTLFTRINTGKIPLTDAELIRALFLKSNHQRRQEIALEWDQMEKFLQSDMVWLFLNPLEAKPENRIRFIFELLAPSDQVTNEHGVFLYFYTHLNKASPDEVDFEWKKLRKLFHQVESWYQERTLYHLVGYLIATGESVRSLIEIDEDLKRDLEMRLKERIRASLAMARDAEPFVKGLSYSNVAVSKTLLFFNVATMLQNTKSNQRFDFAAFKSEFWHIEHVHSQTSPRPQGESEQREWLAEAMSYLPKSHTTEFQKLLDAKGWDEQAFQDLYKALLNEYEDDSANDKVMHSIGNLVLLDRETNTSYKNFMFPVKRGRILNLEKTGKFVPPATRNVFLKAYSKCVDGPLKWSAKNKDDYRNEIIKVLNDFFSISKHSAQ